MIETKDLMLGNWVYDGNRTQFPMYVVGIGPDYVYLDFPGNEGDIWESTPEDLEGIPITDDLLESAGFIKKDGLWRIIQKRREIKLNTAGFVYVEAFENRVKDSRGCSHSIHYLHQLQNFFSSFAKEKLPFETPLKKGLK